MAYNVEMLIPEEKIEARIRELAAEIERDYAGCEITFLVTLKGAVFFACELAKRISLPVFMEFVQTSSYAGTKSTGIITMKLDVSAEEIVGKHIIIIEDVIDTGRTLSKLKDLIQSKNPASLKVCSLVDKHECRVVPFEGDYIGFSIGNSFIVGCGLDVDQRFRNLPYIGIIR
ncbi:MAG: hypoxanthine phosphoribosyltransferase [Methanocorpusculum sp.]|nr:hypoxanthine phosphoribosyltransferase [Lachnospiraceae bacterium]MDO5828933.1 hypoxanthine phosphoribosyltransferase [Methanocorpusculum sp.]